MRRKFKTHYFPKTAHSWSKSARPPCAAEGSPVQEGLTMHRGTRAELSNLELHWFNLRTPEAPLCDSECHLQGFQEMGSSWRALSLSAAGHLCILCCDRLVCGGVAGQVFQSQSSLPMLQSHPLHKTFVARPLDDCNTSALMELSGWAHWRFTKCRDPCLLCLPHLTSTSKFLLNENWCSRPLFLKKLFYFYFL